MRRSPIGTVGQPTNSIRCCAYSDPFRVLATIRHQLSLAKTFRVNGNPSITFMSR